MSTPPIAKEPEVTGLEAVRERLERAQVDIREAEGDRGLQLFEAENAISEALALLKSEREYDPWKFGHHCDQEEGPEHNLVCQLPKGHECDHVHFGSAGLHDSPGDSFRWPRVPASEGE